MKFRNALTVEFQLRALFTLRFVSKLHREAQSATATGSYSEWWGHAPA